MTAVAATKPAPSPFVKGAAVVWHDTTPAVVLSVHRRGKTYEILTDRGKRTFTKRDALKAMPTERDLNEAWGV